GEPSSRYDSCRSRQSIGEARVAHGPHGGPSMNTRWLVSVAAVLVLVAAGLWIWRDGGDPPGPTSGSVVEGVVQDDSGRRVLYWYDPMVPQQHFDKPGKSPFMDMELQPKYADENAAERSGIRIDTSVQQNLGIRVATVARRPLAASIDAVGTVEFNQRVLAIVQARTNGFVTRVYARAAGDVIARGAPLVDLLVPEWAGAQQEFIALRTS